MKTGNVPLKEARKYRKNLARKINRARYISKNNILQFIFKANPEKILDEAEETEKYKEAKNIVRGDLAQRKKPVNKIISKTTKYLSEVLKGTIEFVEKGKKYYIEIMSDLEKGDFDPEIGYEDQKDNIIEGDVYLTDELGRVIGKWNYNQDNLCYDNFLHMQGEAPELLIEKINTMIKK